MINQNLDDLKIILGQLSDLTSKNLSDIELNDKIVVDSQLIQALYIHKR